MRVFIGLGVATVVGSIFFHLFKDADLAVSSGVMVFILSLVNPIS